ncbi:hypothetical protein IFR05_000119 [Cadophora sp. M221]|nr:hypothetical protein IFR05_000119 [Cadophora sp. M221]
MLPESSDTMDKDSQPSLTTSHLLPIPLCPPPRVHGWSEKNKRTWQLWLYITSAALGFALLISLYRWWEHYDIKIFAYPPFLISFTFFWAIFKWRNWLINLRHLHIPESSEQLLAEIAYHIVEGSFPHRGISARTSGVESLFLAVAGSLQLNTTVRIHP